MALVDNAWYVNYGDGSTTGYYAVTKWAALTTRSAGALCRQLAAPAVGSERVFVLIVGNVASGASEPAWTITRGGKTSGDGTETWQECTGIAAINGDFSANTPKWNNASIKNSAITLGQVITDVAGTIVLICTTAGTAGNGAEPTWNAYTTAGATTADNTVTWTNIGVVGNFTAWSGPHARVQNAAATTWGQAGNSIFVGDNHAETQAASMTIPVGGSTTAAPYLIYDVDHTASVPPGSGTLKTTATITTTGASNLTITANAIWNGFTFSAGSGATNATFLVNSSINYFANCSIIKAGTTGTTAAISTTTNFTTFDNTTCTFGATGDGIRITTGSLIWKNTASAIGGATFPTTLLATNGGGIINVRGVDFSALGSGKTLVAAAVSTNQISYISMVDCKLGASVTIAASRSGQSDYVDLIRGDSSGTNYRHERYWYQGTQTVETTIVRTGGASDGTTPISHKIISTANSKWLLPFESIPITIWNNTTGSHTVTVYGTTTGGGVPNNDDIWIEVEYLGTAGNPLGSFTNTTKANNLAASVTTNNSSDASTWGGSGAGNGFKMVTPSFTVNQIGYINVTVKVAKASSTYYIDPLIVVS